jgi:hypothetical protein
MNYFVATCPFLIDKFWTGATFDLFTRNCKDTINHLRNLNQRSMAFFGAPMCVSILGVFFLGTWLTFSTAFSAPTSFTGPDF